MEHEGDRDNNVDGVLGTITKGFVKRLGELEIERRAEAIQTTASLILRSVLET